MQMVREERTSASVFYLVRDDIIFGVLTPGSKLKLENLRERYGLSVPTLREVLNRLAAEGFVDADGQKGFRVAPVSVTGLKEVASMRQLIEAKALRDSIETGGIDWEASVLASHHRLSSIETKLIAGEPADIRTWKQYDKEFHVGLISACSSVFLLRVYSSVYRHYLRYQMLALGFRGESARDEHKELLNLALRRDADAAIKKLIEHIDNGVEHAISSGAIGSLTGLSKAAIRQGRLPSTAVTRKSLPVG